MTDPNAPCEVLFYQLDGQPLEKALPSLLERTLERGWRAVVQATSEERLEALDVALWTYREDSFLPHGTRKEGNGEHQPVWLTTGSDTPNGGLVRFMVDGAAADRFTGYARLVFLFEGADQEAVARAREQWKAARAAGCTVTYWQQGANGKWERKA
jgi:DNA polymerase-3 subunit chi